jgi:hypothetical protein
MLRRASVLTSLSFPFSIGGVLAFGDLTTNPNATKKPSTRIGFFVALNVIKGV